MVLEDITLEVILEVIVIKIQIMIIEVLVPKDGKIEVLGILQKIQTTKTVEAEGKEVLQAPQMNLVSCKINLIA